MDYAKILQLANERIGPHAGDILTNLFESTKERSFNLIVPKSLELVGLSTYSREVDFKIKRGLNFVFGGAHNGKTTIFNAIHFGLLGTFPSSGQTSKYFTNRLSSPPNFYLKMLVDSSAGELTLTRSTKRDRSKLEASILKHESLSDAESSLMDSTKTFDQTQALITELTGISDIDFLTDIYQLFFYNEERNYTLGSRFRGDLGYIYRSRVLMTLCGYEVVNQILTQTDLNLKNLKSELRTLKTKMSSLKTLIPDEKKVISSSKALPNLRKRLSSLEEERNHLNKQLSSLLSKKQSKKDTAYLNTLLKERDDIIQRSIQLQNEFENLDQLIQSTQEIKEWTCPVCQDVVSRTVTLKRVEEGYCPLCGTGHPEISPNARSKLSTQIKELEKQISEKTAKIRQASTSNIDPAVTEEIGTITSKLSQLETEIATIQKEIFELSNQVTKNQGVGIQIHEELANLETQSREFSPDIETYERIREFLLQQVADLTKEFYQQLTKRFGQLQTSMFGKILSQLNEDFTLDNTGR
ncbi:MAG: AAA family ATPase, partial [Promethearchaeota archaeon]